MQRSNALKRVTKSIIFIFIVAYTDIVIAASAGGYAYPPETLFELLQTNNNVAQPETRGSSVMDPVFGTTITRVTDSRILDEQGKSCVNYTYPKIQSWNADMSLLRVSYKLYDANTLEESPITKGLSCDDSYTKLGSPAGSAFRWSHKNSKVFYTLSEYYGKFLFRKNTINGNEINRIIVGYFSKNGENSFEEMTLSEGEGNMSHDGKLVIFKAKKHDNDHVFAVLLNTETKSVKVKELPETSWNSIFVKEEGYARRLYDWITISPKGDHILELKTLNVSSYIDKQHIEHEPDSAVFMYDLDFKNHTRITKHAGHGDIGIDSNGDQVWVQFEYYRDGVDRRGTWSYNLDTLKDKLVGKKLLKYKQGHISCQNYNRPGWCYLSTTFGGGKEVYALSLEGIGLDGSSKVNRFAQTRYQYSSYGGVSPDGKRIVFQSDWNKGGKRDIYHVGLETNIQNLPAILSLLLDEQKEEPFDYGKAGTHIPAEPYKGKKGVDYVTYYPSDIKADKSTPVIFFAPGGFSTSIEDHADYSTILNFIASHGYLVIYVPTNPNKLTDTQYYLSGFIKSAEEDVTMKPYIDTSRIGVMGWSSGGGNSFGILKGLSDKGWGENGRFLFLMDSWFAFDMNKADMSTLPDNTNVIFQKYNKIQDTDPRITLTTHKLLTSISDRKKDYQIYTDVGHRYVKHSGDYSELQYILKPLDALMEYTFIEESEDAYNTALNIGNDSPYETGKEIPESKDSYRYFCHAYNSWSNHVTDIKYCEITD